MNKRIIMPKWYRRVGFLYMLLILQLIVISRK
jgi:hypothetical protein